jgi:hypothetical protein
MIMLILAGASSSFHAMGYTGNPGGARAWVEALKLSPLR